MSENFRIMASIIQRMRRIRRAFKIQRHQFPESEEQIWHPSDIIKLLDYLDDGITYYEVEQLLDKEKWGESLSSCTKGEAKE